MKILYFTGTGNSLYAAKRIGGELISIPQAMKQNQFEFTDDKIGIVCPCYGFTVPKMVQEFLTKATLHSPYIFLIITYGNAVGNATKWVSDYAKKFGIDIAYANTLLTIDNYLPQYDLVEQYKMEKHTEESLDQIIKDIEENKTGVPEANFTMKLATDILHFGMLHVKSLNSPKEFSVNEDCVSCGLCSRVCPRGNIEIVEGKPVFHNSCEFCLACVNNCPKKAIKIKRDKNSNERYRNENIRIQEIVEANQQNR